MISDTCLSSLLAVGCLITVWSQLRVARPEVAELSALAPREHRTTEGRLSELHWAPFKAASAEDPHSRRRRLRLAQAAHAAAERADRQRQNESTNLAAGVGQLLLQKPASAIHWFERAAQVNPHNSDAWSNLAAAQLASSIFESRPSMLPLALASVDRALTLRPTSREGLFNRALIIEHLGLHAGAADAWQRYLEFDSTSGWAREAGIRLRGIEERRPHAASSLARGVEAAYKSGDYHAVQSIVGTDRQNARLWYEVEGLGQWAEAVIAWDELTAERRLREAELVGAALLHLNGEAVIAASAATIRHARNDRTQLQALAVAHSTYRRGRLQYSRQELRPAAATLETASLLLRRLKSPLAPVADFYLATVLFDENRVREALTRLQNNEALATHTALGAQVQAQIGLCHSYAGEWRSAIDALTRARDASAALGELGTTGSAESKLAEVYELLAQRETAWRHRVTAFSALSSTARPQRLIAAIGGAARAEIHAGRLNAARSLVDLELQYYSDGGNRLATADAWRRRSLVNLRLGGGAAAWSDLQRALTAVGGATVSPLRERMVIELQMVEAALRRSSEPHESVRLYGGAIRFFETAGHRVFLPEVYLHRARVYRDMGMTAVAGADLDAGIFELERQRRDAQNAELRESLFDQQTELFEDAVSVAIEGGRPDLGLRYADSAHGRALVDARAPDFKQAKLGLVSAVQERLAPRQALVEFMLVRGGVTAFVVTKHDCRVYQTRRRREDLRMMITEFRAAIEHRSGEMLVRRHGAEIFDELIRPALPALRTSDHLVIVGDRFLEAIPWAALHDSARNRWLIEDFTITATPSAAAWGHGVTHGNDAMKAGDLLLVTGAGGPELSPLPGSTREAAQIGRIYPGCRSLRGAEATPDRFIDESRTARMIHFSGHARDDARGGAALLLSAEGGGATAELSATTVRRLRLPRTRLVILAACSTGRGVTSSVEGMPSLTRAFLIAGVSTVVGSNWEVDDADAAALSTQFHRRLNAGLDAALALRQAQLTMVQSAQSRSRHPAAWAGLTVASV